ncbi:MAG: hypothetical protein HYX40_10610 [Sphingobacteriales bacterium]|nr:hypothetical protein [Sphingobacteriales bacterium]
MKPLSILKCIAFFFFISIASTAQQFYLGGGALINNAVSEKTNPRLGIYFQFERTLNRHNEILIGGSSPVFYSKNQGVMTASIIKAGWRYIVVPDKIYAGINAGMAAESFISTLYGKGWRYHPEFEINTGYLIPYKNGRFDVGISYATFFYKYQNFSWLQLNLGYQFLLPHRKKAKKTKS